MKPFLAAVINELDGLKLGNRTDHVTSEHAQMVRTGASDAIGYLEKQFEARNSHVRALTSKGTVLDSISFRSEEKQDVVSYTQQFVRFIRFALGSCYAVHINALLI